MRQKLISIIIVNWNGMRWIGNCLKSLSVQNYRNIEIIFVDNASTDESVVWVKKHYSRVKVFCNKINTGFAEGNNIGYKHAKGEYVLFLNSDTDVTKTFLTELVSVLENDPGIGGAQSKILLMDDHTRLDSIGAFLTPTGYLYHYAFGKKDENTYNKQIYLYTAKGASMIFRKNVLEQIEVDGRIFNPDYFAYFEETDMCHRIWLSGYRIAYAYKSVIYHKMGAASITLDSAFVQYHSFKNRIASYSVNLDSWHILTILLPHLLYTQIYAFVILLKGNSRLFRAIQRAYWWNTVQFRHTLHIRKIVQKKIRHVSDAEFWQYIYRKPRLAYYRDMFQGVLNYEEEE